MIRAAMILALLAGAAPVAAQTPPPPPPGATDAKVRRGGPSADLLFAGVSEPGRAVLREAMPQARPDKADQQRIRTVRMRVLDLLAADKLDVAALRRAQAEERAIVAQMTDATQERMLAAVQKLSVADRKAFAANMRRIDDRVRDHLQKARGAAGREAIPLPPPGL